MTKRELRYAGQNYIPLAQNRAHRFAQRYALNVYRANAIYSFIPKNACSALRYSLAIENGCIQGIEDVDWIHANNETFGADLRELLTASFTFVILRCPHARLASAFLDKIVHRQQSLWSLAWTKGVSIDPENVTFRDFVTAISRPQILRGDIHWTPQVDFLVYRHYDAFYSFARLDEAFRDIEEKTGMAVHDPRPALGHHQDRFEQVEDGFFGDTPAVEILDMNRRGQSPAKRTLYDDDLMQAVATLYADDINIIRNRLDGDGLMYSG